MSYLEQKFSFEIDDLEQTAESAVKYVKQAKADVPKSTTAKTLIADLKEAVCLLQQDGLEIAFVHRSFQEYFAALFATSLHGEKLKRVLDKYALRFGDSVISMAMDMDRESVEQEWVVPVTEQLEGLLFSPENPLTITQKVALVFGGINFYPSGQSLYPTFTELKFETLGPLETLAALYPEQLGRGHIISKFRTGIDKNIDHLLSEENRGLVNYDVFAVAKEARSARQRRATAIRFDNDNDWWLQIIGVEDAFERMRRGFTGIKKDIASRARRRKVILEEFL